MYRSEQGKKNGLKIARRLTGVHPHASARINRLLLPATITIFILTIFSACYELWQSYESCPIRD